MRLRLGNKGFTLIEMMVVVAIIGIAATIAVPAYLKALPHIRLRAASRAVASTLQLARMTAIAQNKTTAVEFNGTNSYVLDAAHQAQTEDWYGKVTLYLPASGGMFSVPRFYNNKACFDSYGRGINMAGSNTEEAVYLKANPETDEHYRVKVSKTSGLVTVEHLAGGQWVE